MEGTGSYGAGLARWLRGQGFERRPWHANRSSIQRQLRSTPRTTTTHPRDMEINEVNEAGIQWSRQAPLLSSVRRQIPLLTIEFVECGHHFQDQPPPRVLSTPEISNWIQHVYAHCPRCQPVATPLPRPTQ